MSLFKIAWRSIQQRALSSMMTGLSMALGVALVVAVLVFWVVLDATFNRATEGYNIIIGAKGGRLELVLNTVFHIGRPIENIPWSMYKQFLPPSSNGTPGKYSDLVEVAVPFCLGDNYEGYRVVGTTPNLFDELGWGFDDDGNVKKYPFASGQPFKKDDFFGAVIGSVVASKTGLKVGDSFEPTHGVTETEDGHKHDPFVIRGVMAPTGTPNDRALFVNIEGFYLLDKHAKDPDKLAADRAAAHAGEKHDDHAHPPAKPAAAAHAQAGHDHHGHDHHGHDHAHHHHEPLPEDQREVTAILVRTNQESLTQAMDLPRQINEGLEAQAVQPIGEIARLREGLVGNVQIILMVLAVLIVVVAGIGIMVSIYNSMSERRREIAVMRALGAGRQTVMGIILLESILLSLGGGISGFLLGHGLIGLLAPYLGEQTGVPVGFLQFVPLEFVLIPALIGLAALVGYLPALSAYRTDVSKALSATP